MQSESKLFLTNLNISRVHKEFIGLSKVGHALLLLILAVVFIINTEGKKTQIHATLANESSTGNWTNCSQYVANSTFDPSSVVDIDWIIFYFWNCQHEDSYTIRFSVPDILLIKRVRETLHYEPRSPVNWSNAALYMETNVDVSGIFFKTDTPGIYRLLPTLSIDLQFIDELLFGFKTVGGYLGIMNCKGQIAYALAPGNKYPEGDEIQEAANKLGFWNPFGRSYKIPNNDQYVAEPPSPADSDDDDNNMEVEIAKDASMLDVF